MNPTEKGYTLTLEQEQHVRRKWRDTTYIKGTEARLVGGWIDLAGYYATATGDVYAVQRLSAYGGDMPLHVGNLSDPDSIFCNLRGGLFPARQALAKL